MFSYVHKQEEYIIAIHFVKFTTTTTTINISSYYFKIVLKKSLSSCFLVLKNKTSKKFLSSYKMLDLESTCFLSFIFFQD